MLMMKNRTYWFVLSLLIGFSSSVFANNCISVGIFTEASEARNAVIAANGGTWNFNVVNNFGSLNCSNSFEPVFVGSAFYYSVVSGPLLFAEVVNACPSGTVADAKYKCQPVCEVGKISSATAYPPGFWSVGVGATNTAVGPNYARPEQLCDGKCTGSVQPDEADCAAETDGTIAAPQPIHCTYAIKLTGDQCTGGNGDAPNWNPNTDKLCANSASDYPACTPPVTTCANGATDFPTCTPPVTTCANGATDFPTCTSPQTGTCPNGATDYPACTSTSGGGSGTKTCINGASNYPTCTTPAQDGHSSASLGRIDESGTPTGVSSDGSEALDRAVSDRITGFGDNTKRTDLPWSFQFSLPATACSPISWSVFGRVQSIDLCPALERVRTALAYLWYGLACIYCWKRVTGATGATA